MTSQTSPPDTTALPSGTYVSTWMNELHEPSIFIRYAGFPTAELWMSDPSWTVHQVRYLTDKDVDAVAFATLTKAGLQPTDARLDQWRTNLNRFVPDIVLDEREVQWLSLCWHASQVYVDTINRKAVEAGA